MAGAGGVTDSRMEKMIRRQWAAIQVCWILWMATSIVGTATWGVWVIRAALGVFQFGVMVICVRILDGVNDR